MSDNLNNYLGNLVARSLGVTERRADPLRPVIRPRLTSLFEPSRPLGGRQTDAQSADEGANKFSALDTELDEIDNGDIDTRTRPVTRQSRGSLTSQTVDEGRQRYNAVPDADYVNRGQEDWRSLLSPQNKQPTVTISATLRPELDSEYSRDTGEREPVRPRLPSFPIQHTVNAIGPLAREPLRPTAAETVQHRGNGPSVQPSSPSSAPAAPPHVSVHSAQSRQETVVVRNIVTERRESPQQGPSTNEIASASAVVRPDPLLNEADVERIIGARITRATQPSDVPTAAERSSVYRPNRASDIAPVIVRPRAIAPVKPSSLAESEPAMIPPPPVIQVTIGRIEVRANHPAAPSNNRRARPAVMSLDDYLKKRVGGGDR